jgi:aminoglycoside 6-adenylyltransferase
MPTDTLDRVIALAQADPNIRLAILEGSTAIGAHVDALSDYDVNFYTDHSEPYLTADAWMDAMGQVLVYQKESFTVGGRTVPTRLVIYADGPRVDFSFWPLALCEALLGGNVCYESYRNGYVVLVDKDDMAPRLAPPTGDGFAVARPTRDAFLQTVYDAWFEACCVAKYLYRGDLWLAKSIEGAYLRDFLLRLVLWTHQSRRGWTQDRTVHTGGKRLEQWLEADLTAALGVCFSGYDIAATWASLEAALALLSTVARESATFLGYPFPAEAEARVRIYLEEIKQRGKG